MAQIQNFDTYNDKAGQQYIIAFETDGSAVQIHLAAPYATVPVAPPGTFNVGQPFPQMVSVGLNGAVVVAIIAQTGYFIWDGVSLYKQGTASPVTLILDGGADYSSVPSVMAYAGTSAGGGVTLTASIALGLVDQVTVDTPGSGFGELDSAILVFSGGGQGTTAYGLGNLADGVVTSITVVNGGYGYLEVPSLTITPVSGGSGAQAIVTAISGGVIQSVQMVTGGSGFTNGATVTDSGQGSAPGVTPPPPTFQSATYQAVVENGVVVGVSMINVGSGYHSPPTINYVCSSGSGAGGVPELVNTSIEGVTFNYPSQGGSGYQTRPIVQFVGGGGPAAGTLQLMPFGVMGNAIESYQSRLWIANGNKLSFTAPGSIVDFGDGGGEFQSVDGSLRFTFERLVSSNGFLYVIGDSSVFYISGVTTGPISSSNPTLVTTFSYLNVDPQIGTPWPQSVQVFGRRVMLANTNGIYAITGGAVEKISDPVDNLFYNLQFVPPSSGFRVYPYEVVAKQEWFPSSCIVTLFAKPCYGLLIPIVNPLSGAVEVQIIMWDGQPAQEIPRGRWWTATQSAALTFINGLESNSLLLAYGTDGAAIYPLFNAFSVSVEKIVQSRLWFEPTIVMQKKSWGVYALFECYDDTVLNFTTDTEEGQFAVTQGTFIGTGSDVLPATVWGRSAAPDPVGQTIGLTMTSNSPDFAVLDLVLVGQDYVLET